MCHDWLSDDTEMSESEIRRRHRTMSCDSAEEGISARAIWNVSQERQIQEEHWKRILLLIVAITVHNIPEGLAVGVGFGAIGKSKTASFESARYDIQSMLSLLSVCVCEA
jgi:Predicted divalent heavy-metal cations transporter